MRPEEALRVVESMLPVINRAEPSCPKCRYWDWEGPHTDDCPISILERTIHPMRPMSEEPPDDTPCVYLFNEGVADSGISCNESKMFVACDRPYSQCTHWMPVPGDGR